MHTCVDDVCTHMMNVLPCNTVKKSISRTARPHDPLTCTRRNTAKTVASETRTALWTTGSIGIIPTVVIGVAVRLIVAGASASPISASGSWRDVAGIGDKRYETETKSCSNGSTGMDFTKKR